MGTGVPVPAVVNNLWIDTFKGNTVDVETTNSPTASSALSTSTWSQYIVQVVLPQCPTFIPFSTTDSTGASRNLLYPSTSTAPMAVEPK